MKNFVKYTISFLTCTLVSSLTAYFVTPERYVKVNEQNFLGESSKDEVELEKIKKLKEEVQSIEEYRGHLNLNVSYNEYRLNLQGDLFIDLSSSLEVVFDGDLSYNNKSVNLDISYLNSNVYATLFDVNIKQSNVNNDELLSTIAELGINLDFLDDFEGLDINTILELFDSFNVQSSNQENKFYIDSSDFNFVLTTNDKYEISKISLREVNFNDVTLSLVIDTNENTLQINEVEEDKYLEMLSLKPLINKIADIANKKEFAVDFNVSLSSSDINATVSGKANIDLVRNYYQIDSNLNYREEDTRIKLDYFENYAYLALNNHFKGKMSTDDINLFVEKISSKLSFNSDLFEELMLKIFSNAFVLDILNKKYERVVDLIKSLKNVEGGILLELNFEKLNLGLENTEVTIFVPSNENAIAKLSIFNLNIEGIDVTFDVEINEASFVQNDLTQYGDYGFVNTVFDQVESLIVNKKFNLGLSGSLVSTKNNFEIDGNVSFDVDKKEGSGNINLLQKTETKNYTHNLKADLYEGNLLYAVYNDELKAKADISSMQDIINSIKDLLKNTDSSFDPSIFEDLFSTDVLLNILKNGDYIKLISDMYIKQFALNGNILDIELDKAILGLASDLKLRITINNDLIESLEIVDYVLDENTLNLKITLNEYQEENLHLLSQDDTYIDINSLAYLAKCAAKTTTLKFYHLQGIINLNILNIINANLNANCYIDVSSDLKVYLELSNIPVLPLVSEGYKLGKSNTRSSKIIYEKGYVHLERTTTNTPLWGSPTTKVETKKVDEKYFLANIGDYLLGFVIGLNASVLEQLFPKDDNQTVAEVDSGTVEGELTEEKSPLSQLLKEFTYDEATKSWNIVSSIGGLLNTDILDDLTLNIAADENDYLNRISVSTSLKAGIEIKLGLNAELLDIGSLWTDSTIAAIYDEYISNHLEDPVETFPIVSE